MDRSLLDAEAAAEGPAPSTDDAAAAAERLAALDPFPDMSEEQVVAMIEAVARAEASGGGAAAAVPEDLRELVRNAKRARGDAVERDAGTELVTPKAGWVIKTSDRATGQKVFINVCTSDRIPAPGAWANGALPPEEVEAALEAVLAESSGASGGGGAAAAEALRFPLSVGSARPDADKAGAPCLAIDAVVADAVAAAAAGHRPFKAFLIDLILHHVGSKHKLDLDPQYKLPKMAYKGPAGGPGPQRVRREPRALVAEVPAGVGAAAGAAAGGRSTATTTKASGSSSSSKQGAATTAAGAAAAAAKPAAAATPPADLAYTLQFEGRPVACAKLMVQLPAGCAAADVRAEVAGRAVTVAVAVTGDSGGSSKGHAPPPLRVELPFAVDAAAASAALVRAPAHAAAAGGAATTLEVALPYKPLRDHAAALVAAAPRAFGALPVASGDAYMELS